MSRFNSDANKMWCSKHGDYPYNYKESNLCPKCEQIRKEGLCISCEKHKATVDYSESAFEWSHFGTARICQCCYFKKVEDAYFKVKANYEKLKEEMVPCL